MQQQLVPRVAAILVLDGDGQRLSAKYYGPHFQQKGNADKVGGTGVLSGAVVLGLGVVEWEMLGGVVVWFWCCVCRGRGRAGVPGVLKGQAGRGLALARVRVCMCVHEEMLKTPHHAWFIITPTHWALQTYTPPPQQQTAFELRLFKKTRHNNARAECESLLLWLPDLDGVLGGRGVGWGSWIGGLIDLIG
jgi:hypothetical protein